MSDQASAATTSRQRAVQQRIDQHIDGCSTCRRYLLDDDDWYQPCPILDALYEEHDNGSKEDR